MCLPRPAAGGASFEMHEEMGACWPAGLHAHGLESGALLGGLMVCALEVHLPCMATFMEAQCRVQERLESSSVSSTVKSSEQPCLAPCKH